MPLAKIFLKRDLMQIRCTLTWKRKPTDTEFLTEKLRNLSLSWCQPKTHLSVSLFLSLSLSISRTTGGAIPREFLCRLFRKINYVKLLYASSLQVINNTIYSHNLYQPVEFITNSISHTLLQFPQQRSYTATMNTYMEEETDRETSEPPSFRIQRS